MSCARDTVYELVIYGIGKPLAYNHGTIRLPLFVDTATGVTFLMDEPSIDLTLLGTAALMFGNWLLACREDAEDA
jgi:hypothetical protein